MCSGKDDANSDRVLALYDSFVSGPSAVNAACSIEAVFVGSLEPPRYNQTLEELARKIMSAMINNSHTLTYIGGSPDIIKPLSQPCERRVPVMIACDHRLTCSSVKSISRELEFQCTW